MPSTPARASVRRDALREIKQAEWPPDDPRWEALHDAYAMIGSATDPRWAETPGLQETCAAVMALVEAIVPAFNVDGASGDAQITDIVGCIREVSIIANSLDRLMMGD